MAAAPTPSAVPNQHARTIIRHLPGMINVYSDGSLERLASSEVPACSDFVDGVASKDVVLDSSAGIWARIFLPQLAAQGSTKVPLVLHFHGGGFCVGSPAVPHFHEFCSRMAVGCRCIWVSINYRLAPENPLPAAYDDAYAALLWLHSQASAQADASGTESWLGEHADFSKCFLAGESAGGTIVHFLAARAAGKDWGPLRIQGLVLVHPYFSQRKPTMVEKSSGIEMSLERIEFFRKSALPEGAEWGHPWENPLHPDCPKLSDIGLPRVLVAAAEKDVFYGSAVEYYKGLKEAGKNAQLFESQGEGHCFHFFLPSSEATQLLETQIIRFIHH